MLGIEINVEDLLNNSMKSWKLDFNPSEENQEKLISAERSFRAIAYLNCCLFFVWSC